MAIIWPQTRQAILMRSLRWMQENFSLMLRPAVLQPAMRHYSTLALYMSICVSRATYIFITNNAWSTQVQCRESEHHADMHAMPCTLGLLTLCSAYFRSCTQAWRIRLVRAAACLAATVRRRQVRDRHAAKAATCKRRCLLRARRPPINIASRRARCLDWNATRFSALSCTFVLLMSRSLTVCQAIPCIAALSVGHMCSRIR